MRFMVSADQVRWIRKIIRANLKRTIVTLNFRQCWTRCAKCILSWLMSGSSTERQPWSIYHTVDTFLNTKRAVKIDRHRWGYAWSRYRSSKNEFAGGHSRPLAPSGVIPAIYPTRFNNIPVKCQRNSQTTNMFNLTQPSRPRKIRHQRFLHLRRTSSPSAIPLDLNSHSIDVSYDHSHLILFSAVSGNRVPSTGTLRPATTTSIQFPTLTTLAHPPWPTVLIANIPHNHVS